MHADWYAKEFAWKDKILDSEIETWFWMRTISVSSLTWKDKILDSEIETRGIKPPCSPSRIGLEKIRFSIPRLKREKVWTFAREIALEKIRFSIPRLKRIEVPQCIQQGLMAWKDKILDSEIETGSDPL